MLDHDAILAADIAFVDLMITRARALRDAHPTGFVLASIDEMFIPMRRVAFDMHPDWRCESPIVIADRTEAEAAAAAWNDRLPVQFRDTLSIAALEVEGWSESFIDTLDLGILQEEAA